MRKPWFQVLLVACLFIFLRCWPMFLQGKTLYFADNYSLLAPGKVYTAEWLRQGVIPLWNPYLFAGIPWVGDVSQSVLYFTSGLFVWLPPALALNTTVVLHLLIAFVGMYLLARRWTNHQPASLVAGALWAGSTHVSGSINNLATIQSIVWIPWLLWMGLQIGRDKRAPVWFALLVLIQFTGGYPQHVLYGIVMAVVFSAFRWWEGAEVRLNQPQKLIARWRPWIWAWLVTATLSISSSAVIWLPFVEVLLDSTRMLSTTAQAAIGSLEPAMLIKLLNPYFFDKPLAGMKWGPTWSGQPNVVFYVTWLGLFMIGYVLAFAKTRRREDWLLGGFCLATIIFSMGENIPGFTALQTAIPLFRVSRSPSMVLMLTNVALIVWVASAMARFSLAQNWQRWVMGLLSLSLVAAIVAASLSYWQFESVWQLADQLVGRRLSGSQFHTLARDQVIAQAITQSWLVASALTLAAVWAISRKRWSLVVGFLMLDMLYHTQAMFFYGPAAVYPKIGATSVAAQLVPADPQHRWLTRNFNQPYTDYGSYWEAMVVRAPFSDSFVDAYELATTEHAQRLREGLTPNWNAVYEVPTINGYTALVPQDFARYWEKDGEASINAVDKIEIDNALLAKWAVEYYLVDTWFKIDEPLPGEPIATYRNWQLYRLPALARFRLADDTPVELEYLFENPNQLKFKFTNPGGATQLRVADRYDKNWVADVNGQVVKVEESDGQRLLAIQPGSNTVDMRFQPRYLMIGLWITILGLGCSAGWWWWARERPELSTRFKPAGKN